MAPRESTDPRKHRRIYRLPKIADYLVVPNAVFSDAELSWEARGVLGYLLSKPDHWQVRLHDLLRHGPAGEHKMRRILTELRRAGYLVTRRFKRQDGTFDWITTIFEFRTPPEARPSAEDVAAWIDPR